MKPRRQPFETFSPGRRDKRVGEAKAFLKGARHLRNCDAYGLSCQFNLKHATAEALLNQEKLNRREITLADLTPDQRRAMIDPEKVDVHAIAAGPIMDSDKIYLPAGRVSLAEAEAREGLRIEAGDA